MLRPELIVPPIIEKLFASIDNTNEPHRFTSIMTCLTRITRQLVRQTACYSQGQTYVLPLIMSVLPGIDLNDFKKTSITLEFLNTIFMLITCVDCSSAIHIRKDLTDIEKEVCLSTAKFGDFINEFLDRIFRMIKILSTDMSDAAVWGQPVDVDKFQVQFHIPGDDELDFVREFVETFIYIELDLLKETNSKLSNNERLRSLTIVHHIAMGCFRIVPRIGSPNVQNLVPTVVSYSSQSQAQYSMYSKEPKFRENLRLRLLIDIGKLLGQYFIDESFQTYSIDFVDILVANHSDDVASIKIAHKIRRQAQTELFSVLSRYRFSSQVIVDRITELLNASSEVDHDQIKYAIQSIAAICRLQKSPRIYVEKSLDGILHETKKESSSVTMHDECHPGDRDDNLWVTMDCYKPPETQAEWEQTCFLDKTFHGYYTWPKMIKYSMNKRARYTQNDMPEQVAIIYNRFMDKNFLIQSTKLMISDEHTDEINFDYVRVTMFKEHEDPRRMYRLIDFMRTLINNRISSNTFNEISRWSLIQTLRMFQWRIPSIWCTIHEYARELLDHSFKPVREHIANRMHVAMAYLHGQYLETLIEQLEQVRTQMK
ncbi:unnamed protein product [Rotaria sordida]|uniref:Uncharacterized protein n=1 Tax=Rotaria sordida TaxID=392033 RepID=A0A818SXE8_9BILA|nr:unnamed protein product [Rotaria sordida]